MKGRARPAGGTPAIVAAERARIAFAVLDHTHDPAAVS